MLFPNKETEIAYLAKRMVKGYYTHSGDFPKVKLSTLLGRNFNYLIAKDAMFNAKAAACLAAKKKKRLLKELCIIMKNDLKKSEVDTKDNPEKLKEIGWSVKSSRQPADTPAQPTNLRISQISETALQLKWDSPLIGTVRNYIIESRQQECGKQFSQWLLAAFSYKTQIILTDRPKGIKLEYRVLAVNPAGQSLPSNTIAISL